MDNVHVLHEALDTYDYEHIKEIETYEWIVYWYETEPYAGRGVLAAKKDGRYTWSNLGHCSCYGPTEKGIGLCAMDIDDLLKDLASCEDDYDYEWMSVVRDRVLELEGLTDAT